VVMKPLISKYDDLQPVSHMDENWVRNLATLKICTNWPCGNVRHAVPLYCDSCRWEAYKTLIHSTSGIY
jgi:hypothetical protein